MSALPDTPDGLDELAGEYVLGTLPGARRRDVEARLPHDAALRAAVDRWEERLLPLTDLAAPVEAVARAVAAHRDNAVSPTRCPPGRPAAASGLVGQPVLLARRGRQRRGRRAGPGRRPGLASRANARPGAIHGGTGRPPVADARLGRAGPGRPARGATGADRGGAKFRPIARWSSGPRPTVGPARCRWAWSSRANPCASRWTSCPRWNPTSCLN